MLLSGLVWITREGQLTGVNHESDFGKNIRSKLIEEDKNSKLLYTEKVIEGKR